MLDNKKVGVKLASKRKQLGYSQENLAELLNISPQAISKWENGHTLPDTALLPVLAQIFNCTIDEIIMSAYTIDERIEESKPDLIQQQAEHIAEYIIKEMEKKMITRDNIIHLDDETIINSVCRCHADIGNCVVKREKSSRSDGNLNTCITVSAPQSRIKLIERIYCRNDIELYRFNFIQQYTKTIPLIYHIDMDKKILLMEDLNDDYIQGYHFNESNEYGDIIRANHKVYMSAAAEFHSACWENYNVFEQIGLDWRLDSKENLLSHISSMEKDFKKYRRNEESGKIPKVSGMFENHITADDFECFDKAVKYMKDNYPQVIESRFHTGKNITVIHGDMHPGTTYISNNSDKTVKFIGLQAMRIGLCTEDLAMFTALHVESDKQKAQELLDWYYECLCKNVKDYPYETFMNDYRISIAENMFFTTRLINRGIHDFYMRDRAVKAFRTFVAEEK